MKPNKILLIIILFAFFAEAYAQVLILRRTGQFFLYNIETGTNTIDEDYVILNGEESRERTTKNDTTGTRLAPQRWIVYWQTGEEADSIAGSTATIYHLPEETEFNYYYSMQITTVTESNLYKKGADSTFTTPSLSGLFTSDNYLLYVPGGIKLYSKQDEED